MRDEIKEENNQTLKNKNIIEKKKRERNEREIAKTLIRICNKTP